MFKRKVTPPLLVKDILCDLEKASDIKQRIEDNLKKSFRPFQHAIPNWLSSGSIDFRGAGLFVGSGGAGGAGGIALSERIAESL